MTLDRNAFFIGNAWVKPASTRRFEIIGASTSEVIATVPEGVEADIDAAVAAARDAFDNGSWAKASPAERAEVMQRFITALAKRSNELAQAVSMQNGMPISVSGMLEGQFSIGVLAYYAERGESPLRWGGAGAARLGLDGVVGADHYADLFCVGGARGPITGKRPVRTERPAM